jgi:hypothetical protein
VSASATAAIQGRKRPPERSHGLPHVVDKSTEDGTTINSSTDAQGGSEMRESMGDLNSQVSSVTYNSVETEHSIIAHETKEQILELAAKDALYDGDGGDSDIDCNEDDLHHSSVIEEDKVPFDLDMAETKGTSEKWSRPWLTEQPPAIKFDCPQFDEIDNPGCWSAFSYQPKYEKKKYIGHFMPGGATVVPKADGDTKRIVYNESKTQKGVKTKTDWETHYITNGKGWRGCPQDSIRNGTSREMPFTEERAGKLDAEVLKKLGMSAKQMKDHDALFF